MAYRNKSGPDVPPPDSKLTSSVSPAPPLTLNPADFAQQYLSFKPDPTQASLLRDDPYRCILACSRQWGKSTVTAAKAIHHAYSNPDSLTLVLSPTARQSYEFVRKARVFLHDLAITPRRDSGNSISLLLPNQSRIVGLPGNQDTIRGFSGASLLIVDEAARVSDPLYDSIRPSLAASNGQLWILSTPAGRRGFFYKTWISPDPIWTRITVRADQCSRISPALLNEHRATMSDSTFEQEYLCEFHDSDRAVFLSCYTQPSLTDLDPLILLSPGYSPTHPSQFHVQPPLVDPISYIGLDLGMLRNFAAICVLQLFRLATGINRATYQQDFETVYAIRFLHRFPLGTPYSEIVRQVCLILRHPSLGTRKFLAFDATGPGTPVIEMIRNARPDALVTPVIFTSGTTPSSDGYIRRVPRKDLLTSLQIAFETGRLKIAKSLPAANTLLEELANVRHSFNHDGADLMDRERSSIHDDLVFATALANWKAVTPR